MGYDPNNLSSAVNAMKFNYNMSRSYAPVVTASFDKAFVDAVIVEPVVIQPRITTTNTTSSIKKQESFTFIATFYNDYSEEATFFVSTSSNNNGVAINPQVVNVTVPAMSNRQVSFVGTGLTAGASQICVTATSQSQFGGSKSAQSCFNVRVTEEVLPAHCGNNICEAILGETVANCPSDCKPSSCGNGVCDNGENTITCPSDCGTPVVCDYPLVPYKKENFSLFGQWGTGVLGTGFLGSVIETGCTLDPIIIVLGFVFLIVVVLAIAKMARWI